MNLYKRITRDLGITLSASQRALLERVYQIGSEEEFNVRFMSPQSSTMPYKYLIEVEIADRINSLEELAE
jgi:hypothetical protein